MSLLSGILTSVLSSGGPTAVTRQEGLHANRPATPSTALMWYSTDIDQLFQYTQDDGWMLIG